MLGEVVLHASEHIVLLLLKKYVVPPLTVAVERESVQNGIPAPKKRRKAFIFCIISSITFLCYSNFPRVLKAVKLHILVYMNGRTYRSKTFPKLTLWLPSPDFEPRSIPSNKYKLMIGEKGHTI